MSVFSAFRNKLAPPVVAVADSAENIRLVLGTEVTCGAQAEKGVVDHALIKLCADAKIDSFPRKHVAACVFWLLKEPSAAPAVAGGASAHAVETMLTQAKASVATDEQRNELVPEIETAHKVFSFVHGKQEDEGTHRSAEVFVYWLFSLVSGADAAKIYRPWNEKGEQGFSFTNKDFAPFAWTGSVPKKESSLVAGGDAGAAGAVTHLLL